jgi:hypothetical protein
MSPRTQSGTQTESQVVGGMTEKSTWHVVGVTPLPDIRPGSRQRYMELGQLSCAKLSSDASGIWLFGTQTPRPLQHAGNVTAGAGGGWSQPRLPHAPVSAPVNGSAHGTHLFPAQMAGVSNNDCAATAGRQDDRQRPGIVVPANATQSTGSKLPLVAMMGSGTQNPPGQVARRDCDSDGTSSVGRQWAPPQDGLHAAKVLGLYTFGPVQGQLSTTGGSAGSSQARLQAPVGAFGSDAVGSKQGMQRSSAAHSS